MLKGHTSTIFLHQKYLPDVKTGKETEVSACYLFLNIYSTIMAK